METERNSLFEVLILDWPVKTLAQTISFQNMVEFLKK